MAAESRTTKRPRRSAAMSPSECTLRVLSVLSDQSQHVMVLQGAGISVAAGIPDFRSKGKGIYANPSVAAAFTNLPSGWKPMWLFNKQKFDENPAPLCTLLHRLRDLQAKPTHAHKLSDLLAKQKRLTRCYTQNIDALELNPDLVHLSEENVQFLHGKIPRLPGTLAANDVADSICFIGQPVDMPSLALDLQDASMLLVLGTSLVAATACDIVADFRGHRVLVTTDPAQELVPRRVPSQHGTSAVKIGEAAPLDIVLRMDVQDFASQALATLGAV
eukprot:m.203762 g.203762  ORF g.203762 m.203762 type:complete len:275 (+) comp18860_c0_seq1:66-890(+)